MHLMALLLGLFLEHRLTRLFSLRELRLFDAWFDGALALMRRRRGLAGVLLAVVTVALPVLPFAWACLAFPDAWLGLPFFAFAVLLLLVSLGPRNLVEDVEDFAAAVRAGDEAEAARRAKALVEHDVSVADGDRRLHQLREAVFVQANNRLFGVVFWFVVLGPLGPAGALLFRFADLLRRRVVFQTDRARAAGEAVPECAASVHLVHGLLAWPPARLLALAYALGGSFDDAVKDWRAFSRTTAMRFFEANEAVLACVGLGALGGRPPATGEADAVEQALALVNRAFWVWLTAIAVLTLAGSVR